MATEKIDSLFDMPAVRAEIEQISAMLRTLKDEGKEQLLISRLRRRAATLWALAIGIIIGVLITHL